MEERSDENITKYTYTLEELVKKGTISQKIYDKVKLGTSIIEKKYYEKENQFAKYEKIDNTINSYFKNITYISDLNKAEIKKIIYQKISRYNRLSRQKLDEKRFEIISEIGQGGFGKVNLCIDRKNNEIFAMKKLKLELLINKAQLFHINTEKNILALNSNDMEWKAKLNYSFIRKGYLYFIMDYYPGRDLLHYMNRKDTLTEDEAKFYISEIILGVESLHRNNCIHRDIKPDNIFIDQEGHLKIGDFGLSILSSKITFPYTYKWSKNENNDIMNKLIGLSNVGSLLYVAPEVIENKEYGEEIDWWSVGVIFYEMLVGFPPFWNHKDSPKETCLKLKNFKKYLRIPKELKISEEAKKLIFDFLSERDKRLGKNGIEEIKNHIFFKDYDWDNVRKMIPPFVPKPFVYDKDKYHFRSMRKNSLQFYTSKENIKNNKIILELKQEKEKDNSIKKNNFDYYDFYYNRELVELKYNIENNIIELIKKEIENYSKLNTKSTNITLEETSTEEIASLKSNASSKNKNINLSRSYYNTERKNIKKSDIFIAFDNNNDLLRNKKQKLEHKNSIQIIPIRNLINSQNLFYKTSSKKNCKYEPIYKRKYSNNVLNDKNKIKSEEKILIKNKINPHLSKNKIKKNIIKDNDKKKMKINGKFVLLKKNIGKYLLEQ